MADSQAPGIGSYPEYDDLRLSRVAGEGFCSGRPEPRLLVVPDNVPVAETQGDGSRTHIRFEPT